MLRRRKFGAGVIKRRVIKCFSVNRVETAVDTKQGWPPGRPLVGAGRAPGPCHSLWAGSAPLLAPLCPLSPCLGPGGGGGISSNSTGMCGHKMEGYGSFLGL